MTKPMEESYRQGKELILLLSSVLVFALSINLISSYIAYCLCPWYKWIVLVVGVILFCVGIALTVKFYPIQREYVFRYNGGISFEIENDMVRGIHIAGYRFNDDFVESTA